MSVAEVSPELEKLLASAPERQSVRYEVTHGGKYATVRYGTGDDRVTLGNIKFEDLPEERQREYWKRKRKRGKTE